MQRDADAVGDFLIIREEIRTQLISGLLDIGLERLRYPPAACHDASQLDRNSHRVAMKLVVLPQRVTHRNAPALTIPVGNETIQSRRPLDQPLPGWWLP